MKWLLIILLFPISLCAQTGTAPSFSRSQINDDISFLVTTINHVHPNPYHDISEKKFNFLIDSLRNSLKEKSSLQDAWIIFSKIMASLNEGHSSIGYPAEIQKNIQTGSIKVFPVVIREFNGEGLVVRYDLSADGILKTGDIITAINGRRAKDLMHQLTSLLGGLPNWRNIQVLRDFAGQLVLHNIQPPYKINFSSNGIKKEIQLQPVTLMELQSRAAETRKKNSVITSQAQYTFQRTAENIGYLDFRSMQNHPAFIKFLDSVFADIKSKPIAALIIDLRQNGGGDSQLGESLIGYFSEQPFKMGGGVMWKISGEYKAFINEQAKTNPVYASGSFKQYLNMKTGDTWNSLENATHKAGKNNLRYSGKVYVLTGPNTFSSANMLANAVKDFKLATIIGEATGEAPNDFGELYWNKLPNTGLSFYTCSKQFIRANGDAKDLKPVLPDIEVKQNPNSLKDDVLEFAKKWIKSN